MCVTSASGKVRKIKKINLVRENELVGPFMIREVIESPYVAELSA